MSNGTFDPATTKAALDLLDSVLEVAEEERAQWLSRQTTDDTVLALVRRWLSELDSERFDSGVEGHVQDLLLTLDRAEMPKRLGHYRVVDVLGHGGMGVVYKAGRDDGEYQQEVALKLMPGGAVASQDRLRFQRERQILARLNHPSIATLLDGGTTDEGQLYLVMELINGEPLTNYANARELNVRQRIQLLLQIADAVAYAENRLVVHGDLKPSNVLVTEDGRAKLLDFGIARLMTGGGEQENITLTRAFRPLTPAYSSPEQIMSEPLTTATDVYQLGLLLYRLVTGFDAQTTDGGTYQDIREVVCETDVTLPSQLRRRADFQFPAPDITALRLRDLDAIIARALAKEPGARYSDAAEFAGDLRRFLDQLPVMAVPPTLSYRVSKYVRRRAGIVAGGVIAVTAITAFVSLLLIQERRVSRERDLAELEATRASAVADYLVDIISSANTGGMGNDSSTEVTVAQVIDSSIEKLEVDLLDQPEVRGRLMILNGSILQARGEDERAKQQILKGLAVLDTGDPLATALERHSAYYNLAPPAFRAGEAESGFAYLQKALDAYGDGRNLDPGMRARTLMRIGQYKLRFGHHEDATGPIVEALEIYRSILDMPLQDETLSRELDLAMGLIARADIETYESNPTASLPFLEEALTITSNVLNPSHRLNLGIQTQIGREYFSLGQFEKALELQSRAHQLLTENFAPSTPDFRIEYIVYKWLLARILNALGDPGAAIEILGEAEGLFSTTPQAQRFYPRVYSEYCRAYDLLGQREVALENCDKAIDLHTEFFGEEHIERADLLIQLADLEIGNEAPALYDEADRIRSSQLDPSDWRFAEAKALVLMSTGSEISPRLLEQLSRHQMYEPRKRAERLRTLATGQSL